MAFQKRRAVSSKRGGARKKFCRFCAEPSLNLDYKNVEVLQSFITERGKIIPRRITGTCEYHQVLLTVEIKRARQMALLFYTTTHSTEVLRKMKQEIR